MLEADQRQDKMAASHSQTGMQDHGGQSAKNIPKDALVMAAILKEMGVSQYEPRVINQMLEFSYRYVTDVLEDARVYSLHADKKIVDLEDVQLAVESRLDHSFTRPPPREFLLDIARKKNSQPLPLIADKSGVRLPPDRYCLTASNYKLKPTPGRKMTSSVAKAQTIKLHTNKMQMTGNRATAAVHAKPSTPVDQKPPLSLLGLDIKKTVVAGGKIAPSNVTTPPSTALPATTSTTTKSIAAQPTRVTIQPTMSTSTISNLPSMEETTASASAQHQQFPNLLKRKREDDDEDYDM